MRWSFYTLCAAVALCCVSCGDDKADDDGGIKIGGTVDYNLIDSNATTATETLFDNLFLTKKVGVMVGQQEAYFESDEYTKSCDIYDISGKYPLMSGADFGTLTNDDYTSSNWYGKQATAQIEWVKECYKEGVFTTFSWHFREPQYGDSFYTSDMTSATAKAAFPSILEGGEYHSYYKGKLDMIADFCKSLTDENGNLIPIIFRPWHEMDGSWFWWGVPDYATTAQYIQNWQFTVKYLRDTKGVHNIIYAFSPNKSFTTEAEYLNCYPGDDYVDVVGFDSYEDYSKGTSYRDKTTSQLAIISEVARSRGKIAALTECGYDLKGNTWLDDLYVNYYLKMIEDSGAEIAYMMFWYNSTDKNFIPTSDSTSDMTQSFCDFVNSDTILMMGDIK